MRSPKITYFHSLSAAGFAATAISYGPARMGFGLFVPEFRSDFSMSSTTVGLVSSLGFFGFFLGLWIAQLLLNRKGPEYPVLSGMLAATVGIVIVAFATNVTVLATGVFIAASSAGFAWTPFNDAVHRKIRDVDRPAALSEISTGTSVGIALAGAVALAMVYLGLDWRVCWAFFALCSVFALIANWAALRHVEKDPNEPPQKGWRDLLHSSALPLYGVAFVYGVTSAVYISFSADHYSEAGGMPGIGEKTTPALLFLFYGVFGLAGLFTTSVRNRIGLTRLVRALMMIGATSLALVALLPGNWIGLIASAGLQGINVMMLSGVLAFWSERLFPSFPALGFTSTLMSTAAGSVIGSAVAGTASSAFGSDMMFLGTALLPLIMAFLLLDRFVVERPASVASLDSEIDAPDARPLQ